MDGSQSYDAEVFQHLALEDVGYHPEQCYLVVTTSVHQKEHRIREVLQKTGVAFGPDGASRSESGEAVSELISYSNRSFIPKDAAFVLNQLSKKASKSYPANTTLIILCKHHFHYTKEEWDALMKLVFDQIAQNSFREIFVTDSTSFYQHIVYPN